MIQHNLEVVQVDLGDIHQHPDNANNGDIEQIARSIARNGVYTPLIVQKSTGYILKGNHTYAAILSLGLSTAPVSYVDVDDERAKRILLVDNKSARSGRMDRALEYELLAELRLTDEGFDGTGYSHDYFTELEGVLFSPLDFDDTPKAEVEPSIPVDNTVERELTYTITAVADDATGLCYEFEVTKRGGKPLTAGDYNKLRKALGAQPFTKEQLAAQGVPAWARGH